MINEIQLRTIMPYSTPKNRDLFLPFLNKYMEQYGINTKARKAAFLAQIAHESGSLRYVKEIASGEAYDTGSLAKRLGNTPEADGDGQKYKGRGLIQITGRGNYEAASKGLGLDLINKPELLETPEFAVKSACWWWNGHGLNAVADSGDFRRVTKIINGGYNGLASREAFHKVALNTLT